MRFELPGFTSGPTNDELEQLERHQFKLEDANTQEQEKRALDLGLTLEQFQALQASLEALRKQRAPSLP